MTVKWYKLKPTETHYARKSGGGNKMFLHIGGERLQLEDRNAAGIMDKLIPLDETEQDFRGRQEEEEAAGHVGEKKQDLELRREVANDGMYKVVHGETGEPIHEGVLTLEESNILMSGGSLPEAEPEEDPPITSLEQDIVESGEASGLAPEKDLSEEPPEEDSKSKDKKSSKKSTKT